MCVPSILIWLVLLLNKQWSQVNINLFEKKVKGYPSLYIYNTYDWVFATLKYQENTQSSIGFLWRNFSTGYYSFLTLFKYDLHFILHHCQNYSLNPELFLTFLLRSEDASCQIDITQEISRQYIFCYDYLHYKNWIRTETCC